MSYICGGNFVTSGDAAFRLRDLREWGRPGPTGATGGRARVVPDLYRRPLRSRLADAFGVAVLFLPLLAAVLVVQHSDRAGVR